MTLRFLKTLCIVLSLTSCPRLPLRNLETHYENVNLQRDLRGRAELFIPRYHELLVKQEEKRVSAVCLCVLHPSVLELLEFKTIQTSIQPAVTIDPLVLKAIFVLNTRLKLY